MTQCRGAQRQAQRCRATGENGRASPQDTPSVAAAWCLWRSALAALLLAAGTVLNLVTGVQPSSAGSAGTRGMGVGRGYSLLLPVGGRLTRVHVEEAGAGPPVVLLHGLGASTFTWRHVAPDLARDHHVTALDFEGFGRSAKPGDAPYTTESQARLVAAFLRRRNLRNVTLAGHSFGGAVALLVAANAQGTGRIRRLILVDAPGLPQEFPRVAEAVSAPVLPEGALAITPPEIFIRGALTLARRPGNPPPEEDIRGYAAPFWDLGARRAFLATARHIVEYNARGLGARARTLRMPTLLVWCRADEIVPYATGRGLARLIPGATLKTLRGCNHLPQDERPGAFVAVIRPFLAGS